MNVDIATALVGFGGAVLGAGASLSGTWLTLRKQSEDAREARRYEIGRLAGEEALTTLLQLREYLETVTVPTGPISPDPWEKQATASLTKAAVAIGRIPGHTLPDRIQKPYDLARAYRYAGPRHPLRVRWVRLMVEDMISVLLDYLRQDELPKVSRNVEQFQETYDRRKEAERRDYERLRREVFDDADPDFTPDDAPLGP
ncbi:hypothetical protein ACSCB1_15190 [Streptomyces europaeiscabiei]|uniref:hypothetical protein n=2 Tax=Streptomyces europaeiscabiei TaxID=146819 RepID=UPI00131AFF31|nr:hypothetical protein [Streptomyces europaeiscabiei]